MPYRALVQFLYLTIFWKGLRCATAVLNFHFQFANGLPLYKPYNIHLNCGCINDGNIGIKVYIGVYTLYLVLIDKTHNCFLNCGCIGNIYFAVTVCVTVICLSAELVLAVIT